MPPSSRWPERRWPGHALKGLAAARAKDHRQPALSEQQRHQFLVADPFGGLLAELVKADDGCAAGTGGEVVDHGRAPRIVSGTATSPSLKRSCTHPMRAPITPAGNRQDCRVPRLPVRHLARPGRQSLPRRPRVPRCPQVSRVPVETPFAGTTYLLPIPIPEFHRCVQRPAPVSWTASFPLAGGSGTTIRSNQPPAPPPVQRKEMTR